MFPPTAVLIRRFARARCICIALAAVAVLGGRAISIRAERLTDGLMVSATVVPACVVQTTRLDFGIYDGTRRNAQARIVVRCVSGVPYEVVLDSGLHSDGTNRRISMDGHFIPYILTKEDGSAWGDAGLRGTFAAGSGARGVGTGNWNSFIVHGAIPAGILAPPGQYTDVVTVSVEL